MKVLGIDTSGYANAIGIVDDGTVIVDFIQDARTDSLEKIVANIDDALKSVRLNLDDIDGIGVGLGPGSWTGIRIGVTVGKILAFSTGKPVAGVPTLDALAYQVRNRETPLLAVISMGAGDNVYAACYRSEKDTVLRTGDYYVGSAGGMADLIEERTVIVGEEAEKYLRILHGKADSITEAVPDVPRGAAVAALAARRLKNEDSDDALALSPLYLKESTARAYQDQYRGRGG